MMGYDGVECQDIAKDDIDFLDKRSIKFVDETTKCLCFKCYRICKIRNNHPKEKQVISCDAFIYEFKGEFNRKVKNRIGLIDNG